MYEILFKKSAIKELKKVLVMDREKIIDTIHELAVDPYNIALDVKKLNGEPGYKVKGG